MVLEIWRVAISSNLGLAYRGVVVKCKSPLLISIVYPQVTPCAQKGRIKTFHPFFLWQNLIEANKARRSRRRTASGSDWKSPSWRSTDIQGHILYAGVRKNASSMVELADRCLHSPSHRLT